MKTPWLLLLAVLGLGCSGRPRTPVVVYSPHGKEMLVEFEKSYEEKFPDQDVQWLDMGSQDVYDRIRTERSNPQADVWWGAPSIVFARAERESLLERYLPSWEGAVPSDARSRGGCWYGTFLTPEVIMYNSRILSDSTAPADWDDLLLPQWRDKIIIRSPLASGTMRIIFSALLQRENERTGDPGAGFRWLARLDANTRTYAADPTQLYLKIAREEGLVTLWDLPDVIIQVRKNGYPFGYRIPSSGTPVITDGIAIVRGSKHPKEARQFYEFVTSRESMIRQATAFGRIPARYDIPADQLPEWIARLRLTPMSVNWNAIEEHEREWMHVWDEKVKGSGRTGGGSP
jgi:iron(III) transport system substrate-binding protein